MINKGSDFQITIATKAEALNSYGANATNIDNHGTINMFYLNTCAEVKLSTFHFETQCYNLFIVDDYLENHGSFFIPFDKCLKNTDIGGTKFNQEFVDYALNFPSLICTRNAKLLNADKAQYCLIAKVHEAKCLDDGIKFRYISSKQFQQQKININHDKLDILSSSQTNELDEIHWEIRIIAVKCCYPYS